MRGEVLGCDENAPSCGGDGHNAGRSSEGEEERSERAKGSQRARDAEFMLRARGSGCHESVGDHQRLLGQDHDPRGHRPSGALVSRAAELAGTICGAAGKAEDCTSHSTSRCRDCLGQETDGSS